MKEYEVFLEIGIVGDTLCTDMEGIGEMLRRKWVKSACRMCDGILEGTSVGWTIGLTDNYMDKLSMLSEMYPDVIFVGKAVDNEEVCYAYVKNRKAIFHDQKIKEVLPDKGEWENAEDV